MTLSAQLASIRRRIARHEPGITALRERWR